MESAKEEAIQLIRRLTDDTTLEEIQYHVYVQQKVRRGMRDVEEGKFYGQEEVEERQFDCLRGSSRNDVERR